MVSSRLHKIVSDWFETKLFLLDFKFNVQAALVFVSQSAVSSLALTVSKQISLLASSDQMAPPSGLPPPLKRRTKLFTFVLIYVDIFTSLYN